ncbi:restriction endonuclease [Comamonas piscis]|uniref:Restriction endonuclease n=1 Tax=Comamonas piscis TaxID=1562974 RepID=A0A7G5EH11_9BURK|nr:restriction endonuclease [Comamonas piscis]QMV73286.1 restriction endonuclease [Comamonas piscis]WSO36085.1 restriction endonuclease [Comamonas piscis]
MDYSKFSWQEFELLCARLLRASGYTLERQVARNRDIGVDFTFTDSSDESWVVEVKHFTRPRTGTTILRQAAVQLNSAKQLTGATKGLLIISMPLPQNLKNDIEAREGIRIWDSRHINKLLANNLEIEQDFLMLMDAQAVARRGLDEPSPLDPRAQELIGKLEALPPGKETFREFEDLCVEILNYAFFPHLGVPSVQSRTEDTLDIRDAVFPITGEHPFWQEIRRTCFTRFMVAEFKNYTKSIGQREVESIQQYLYSKAMRMFGVLCSRNQPNDSALLARRRAWVESNKLILLLSDDELKDLVRAKSYGENPTDVLDAQLGEFFLRLAP